MPKCCKGQWFSTTEIARICGVTDRCVRGWIDRGAIPCVRLPNAGHRRVRRSDLIDFLRGNGFDIEVAKLEAGEYGS